MKRFKKLFILSLVGVLCFTGCGKKNEQQGLGGGSTNEKIKIEANDNIEASAYISYNEKDFILYVKNNNTYDVGSVNITLEYYKNNEKVDEEITGITNYKSGTTYAAVIGMPYDDDLNTYVPDKTVVKISVDQEYQNEVDITETYVDKLSGTASKNGNNVDVTITNNSGKTLAEVYGMVIFKKDGTPIAAKPAIVSDVERTATETIETPTKWDTELKSDTPIDYDSLEVIINETVEAYENINETTDESSDMSF